ncbi:long-chain acyl-CoA synthetase [Bifidobacterium bohemicum]|uniref:Acyl-CoA synthetase n=1 Tax=Bifidobacterium bohemicum DSM 22767 TaxID=1437606 RepID=A0A086ZJQ1_9BIFI|nr:AMP-dependent synthetase/ligase [Bifidobacterium bohemicum]KFI46751.1 long-chain-fatty-acid-CoA ligase [Bifidobacterium bohemicum DSM 22767]SCB80552.1 long-chain acyl-CoA synthetase [Bifidobacterium bohemicum]
MSLIEMLKQQSLKLSQRAFNVTGGFQHPVNSEDPENPDFNEDRHQVTITPVDMATLPSSHEWGPGYPTTLFLDEKTGLLTVETAGIPPIDEGMSIYDLYVDRAERMGGDPLYTYKDDGKWVTKTANDFLEDVRAVAKGLLHYGIDKGDAVAFMSQTSYDWDVVDAAVMAIGGVLATIYETDSAEQIRNIVNNSDSRLLIVATIEMREKASGAVEDCPTLEKTYCLETGALDELRDYGESITDEMLNKRIDSIKKTDLCSIVYTSGSTAAPKGVEMTHEHYCTTALNLRDYMPGLLKQKGKSVLLFLPQAHTFARAVNYIVVASDLRIYISGGIKTLLGDLQVAKPCVTVMVPRVLEKVYNAASQKAGNGTKGVAFAAAVVAAQEYEHQMSENGSASFVARARRAAFDRPVYRSLREVLGGHAEWFVAGGAPLDPKLLAFFRGANVPAYEGYGLTETTAPCAFNPMGTPFHEGSVGVPYPGFSIRLAEDGEIQVKGTCVFNRYHKNDEATELAFTKDGWYATGDLGRISNDGFLYITGRKKDLIITAGGKNVAPGPIEEVIQRCKFVSQALVLGDKRPFISALITMDETSLRSWLESAGLDRDMPMDEACENAVVRAEVQTWVDKANEGVSRAESVRKFILLPEEFSQEDGLLTPSMKVKRPAVIKHYETLLNTQMYTKKK